MRSSVESRPLPTTCSHAPPPPPPPLPLPAAERRFASSPSAAAADAAFASSPSVTAWNCNVRRARASPPTVVRCLPMLLRLLTAISTQTLLWDELDASSCPNDNPSVPSRRCLPHQTHLLRRWHAPPDAARHGDAFYPSPILASPVAQPALGASLPTSHRPVGPTFFTTQRRRRGAPCNNTQRSAVAARGADAKVGVAAHCRSTRGSRAAAAASAVAAAAASAVAVAASDLSARGRRSCIPLLHQKQSHLPPPRAALFRLNRRPAEAPQESAARAAARTVGRWRVSNSSAADRIR